MPFAASFPVSKSILLSLLSFSLPRLLAWAVFCQFSVSDTAASSSWLLLVQCDHEFRIHPVFAFWYQYVSHTGQDWTPQTHQEAHQEARAAMFTIVDLLPLLLRVRDSPSPDKLLGPTIDRSQAPVPREVFRPL